ncbi:DEAD/DEAH box helicase [Flavobacterium alkalisoli]|uniref:DEAD/DEAH box helicase n=1 Tax=Flavobacterium alkalisoli TaxID=2602769 RepID=UPI003A92D4A6
MFLKKIYDRLSEGIESAGFTEPTELQKESFGAIKSGADCVLAMPDGGSKTTTIVINVIQKLQKAFEQSPRALIMVQDKAKVLEMLEIFETLGKFTDLRVYGVYDQTDIDEDKNQISIGIDVLIGTPNKLNDMFSGAGFDVNQLKMFVVDDTEILLKNRQEPKISRLSNSMGKMQRIFFTDIITERVELLADRIMIEPYFFEFDDDDDDE